jgi:hypothetical protein
MHLTKPNSLSAPSVAFLVTIGTKRNQVAHHITPELTPGFHVMDLQVLHGTSLLAAPTIPLQRALSKGDVIFGI